MDDLIAARLQMALTLGFHIIFASIGIAMPFFMARSHWLYLKRGNEIYRTLTKAWSKGIAIFFAVGAVSGTALSFELGLLWPKFMDIAGPVSGLPFAWEGTAFFLEAIALGIFLYGWDKVSPWTHWASGIIVGISGVASGFFVICANAWMNSPAGFKLVNGKPVDIDPYAAMFNGAFLVEGIHMTVGAFIAVGFAIAGLHALLWLTTRRPIHQLAVQIVFPLAAISALAQPFVGDIAAKSVARRQPAKLAAMESLFETKPRAPLLIGGIPNQAERKVSHAIELPGLLSLLVHGDFDAPVTGLSDFPEDEWPPVIITHLAFQIMVALGTFLAITSIVGVFALWKLQYFWFSRFFSILLVVCAPMGFLALESGWVVTEVGRQPWIIYGILRTSEAVTSRPGIAFTFALYAGLYSSLVILVIYLMVRQIKSLHRALDTIRTEGVS